MANRIIHAALEGQGKYGGKAYFFNADQYTRYDWATDRAFNGYPLFISAWNLPIEFLTGIQAAINGEAAFKGKAYFFKGNQYVRYDWETEKADSGYPQPISIWNFPPGFEADIDAAINGIGKFAGKAYFFKGGHYIRYDWAKDKPDTGYPLPLSKWNLPFPFSSGVDAVINGEGKFAGKAYFFKGEQYARYNWNTEKIEAISTIAGNWPLLVELIQAGVARNIVFSWLSSTQPQIKAYILHKRTGVPFPFDSNLFNTALKTHFQIDFSMRDATQLAHLQIIESNYEKVAAALLNNDKIFRGRIQSEAVSDRGVDSFGAAYPAYTFYNHSVNFTATFNQFGPLCQAAMVLHEPVHFVDEKADATNEYYEHSPQYATITADKAVHNPSSYVCFAQHLHFNNDERFGAGRPNE